MTFRAFYCRYRDDFSQEDASPIKTAHIPELAESVLEAKDDFFGVVDSYDTTLQFMVEEGGVWAEIPDPMKRGSTGRLLGKEEVLKLLTHLPDRFDASLLPGAEFALWSATDSEQQ